jgi:hypothetical protein
MRNAPPSLARTNPVHLFPADTARRAILTMLAGLALKMLYGNFR